jgi:hypothetical protein
MTEIEFRRSEIESLAEKLSQDNPQLDDHDRRLFLAIFSAASANVTPGSQAESVAAAEPTLLELKSQLNNAFISGEDKEFIIVCRIGVPPTWPPTPPPTLPKEPTHPSPFPPPTEPPHPPEGSTPEPGQE